MGRIGRSFLLVGQSYRVLMQDKELMVLPLISGITIAIVGGAMIFGLGLRDLDRGPKDAAQYGAFFVLYVACYAIGIFFQAAVIAGATERMRGGNPTVSSALSAAARRIGPILLWAVIASTVGMIIKAVQDRLGFVGRIIVGLIGAAWSLGTFFVVPVLVLEEQPVGASISRSVALFKKTWGETFVGGASLGVAAVCAWVSLVALTGLAAWAIGVSALVGFFVGAVFLIVLFSALQGVLVASLFRYASGAGVVPGFDAEVLENAFVPKR